MTIQLEKRLHRLSLILLVSIVFASSAFSSDYFWLGGSGNWSDFQNHWATTSGGSSLHLNFIHPNTEEVTLQFWDLQGRLQWRHRGLKQTGTRQLQVPIEDLAAGTYLGTLQTATGFAKQVIVHH